MIFYVMAQMKYDPYFSRLLISLILSLLLKLIFSSYVLCRLLQVAALIDCFFPFFIDIC